MKRGEKPGKNRWQSFWQRAGKAWDFLNRPISLRWRRKPPELEPRKPSIREIRIARRRELANALEKAGIPIRTLSHSGRIQLNLHRAPFDEFNGIIQRLEEIAVLRQREPTAENERNISQLSAAVYQDLYALATYYNN